MLLNTFSAIAQEESKAISQNQRLSIVKRMQSGEYVDSNAPYGFRLVEKALVVYEPEAAIVRMMFENYLSGQSTSEIARDLNSRGIKTKTGKSSGAPPRWRTSLGMNGIAAIANTRKPTVTPQSRSNSSEIEARRICSTPP